MHEAPGIEETYVTANNSSNLRVEADKRGSADVLIAAGWSASRMGAALLRLHSEYDGASRPPKGGETDARLLMGQMKSLPAILERMEYEAAIIGATSPKVSAMTVVAWWLDKTCGGCQGRRFQLIPGTPALTAKHCKSCGGTGENGISATNRRLAGFMDDCVSRAQDSIKRRLRDMR